MSASLTSLIRTLSISSPSSASSSLLRSTSKAFVLVSSSSCSPLLSLQASTRSYATSSSPSNNLGNLSPAPGSTHKRKRIGRGIGSGRGGTSGRGHKGQGARSGNGKPKLHFAGGQTPITRAFPKRGFTNTERIEYSKLNLNRLQHWIDRGLIDPREPITMKQLYDSKCVHGIKHGVKLLGDGAEEWRTPNVEIVVSRASQSAIKAIEALDGKLIARYENRLTLRALLRPDSFYKKGLNLPGKADPIKRKDLVFYSDFEKNRGYLGLTAKQTKNVNTLVDEVKEI